MEARNLTPGEIEMARSVFGSAIDYSVVRLVRRKWWPLQRRNDVMTPSGSLYFNPKGDAWSDDFSKEERIGRRALFIHEMTHVWQAQQRGRLYLPLMRHPFCHYAYTIRTGWPLTRYGLEQQAEIAAHVFLLRHGQGVHGIASRMQLETILPEEWRR